MVNKAVLLVIKKIFCVNYMIQHDIFIKNLFFSICITLISAPLKTRAEENFRGNLLNFRIARHAQRLISNEYSILNITKVAKDDIQHKKQKTLDFFIQNRNNSNAFIRMHIRLKSVCTNKFVSISTKKLTITATHGGENVFRNPYGKRLYFPIKIFLLKICKKNFIL